MKIIFNYCDIEDMKKRTHNKISFLTKCNLLIFIFIVNILFVNFHIIANKISTTESSKYGNSFPNSLTINENFRDDEVVVVLKKEYGGLVIVSINSPSNSTNNYLIEKNNYKSSMYFYKLFNNKSVNNLIC